MVVFVPVVLADNFHLNRNSRDTPADGDPQGFHSARRTRCEDHRHAIPDPPPITDDGYGIRACRRYALQVGLRWITLLSIPDIRVDLLLNPPVDGINDVNVALGSHGDHPGKVPVGLFVPVLPVFLGHPKPVAGQPLDGSSMAEVGEIEQREDQRRTGPDNADDQVLTRISTTS